jgi:hypothetical protein
MIYFCCKTNHRINFQPKMKPSIILASIFVIVQLVQIHSHNPMDRSLLIVRNNYLRFYIYTKKDKIKSCLLTASTTIKDRTNIIYNKFLSKYYDAHTAYYSLPQDDREIIEQVINMYF